MQDKRSSDEDVVAAPPVINPIVASVEPTMIGRARQDLITPALVLDLEVAQHNIATMARRMRAMPAKLRPHIKVHKSPQLALMQVEAGAIGVTTATVWEAIAMARGGIEDILVGNQVVGPEKIEALADAAHLARITVAVDDMSNLDNLSVGAQASGAQIGVLIEIDVGMGRSGVRDLEDAKRLAQYATDLPGIELRGVMGYEGHCMLEPDHALRETKARAAMEHLLAAVDLLTAAGFECPIVSAGGTGTYNITGANPRVTEIQAGSYVCMDAFHSSLIPDFDVALTVAAGIISRHGDVIVLDAGRKGVSADLTMPRMVGYEATLLYLNEEHSGFRIAKDSPLRVGDTVELVTGYGPTTVNMYEAYHVVSGGVVVDVWPVPARGYGQLWP